MDDNQQVRNRKQAKTLIYQPHNALAKGVKAAVVTANNLIGGDVFINENDKNFRFYGTQNIFKDSTKILYYFNIVLAIAHLASPITCFILYWLYTSKMIDSFVTIDPTLYDSTNSVFGVTLKLVGSYKLAILLLLPTTLAGIFAAIKAFSIPYDRIMEYTGPMDEMKMEYGWYLETIENGVLHANWIYLFLGVGAFTWTLASICGITNIFIITLLVGCIWAAIYSGWLHEANNASLDEINKEEIKQAVESNDLFQAILQWKNFDAYIFGGLLQCFFWAVTFAYFGLMVASAPSVSLLPWWQWTVPFVSVFFFFAYSFVIAFYTNVADTGYTMTGKVVDLRFQRHVNKEIWLQLIIALCSQIVLWLVFGGMLGA